MNGPQKLHLQGHVNLLSPYYSISPDPTVPTLASAVCHTESLDVVHQHTNPCDVFPVLNAKHADCVWSVGLESNSSWSYKTGSECIMLAYSSTILVQGNVIRLYSWLAVSKSNHMTGIDWTAWSYLHFVLKGGHSSHRRQLCKMLKWKSACKVLFFFLLRIMYNLNHLTIGIRSLNASAGLHNCLFVCFVCVGDRENRWVSWSLPARCLGSEGRRQKNVGSGKVASRSCAELATLARLCAQTDWAMIFLTLTVVALRLFSLARWACGVGQVHPGKSKQASWLCLSAAFSSYHYTLWVLSDENETVVFFNVTWMYDSTAHMFVCMFACWSWSAAHMCNKAFQTSIHPDRRNATDMNVWYLHMVFIHCELQTFKLYSVVYQPWDRLSLIYTVTKAHRMGERIWLDSLSLICACD